MSTLAPDTAAICAALERVINSETFARSERARKLLRYLVEQQLAGNAERLKGFAIALDVFGKDAAHDPSTDAHVRVQAGRLRELLDQYAAGDGANDPFHISIPRGAYTPVYVASASPVAESGSAASRPQAEETGMADDSRLVPVKTSASTSESSSTPASASSRRRSRPVGARIMRQMQLFWVAMGVVISLLGFVAYRAYQDTLLPHGQETDAADISAAIPETADAFDGTLPKVFVSVDANQAPQKVAAVLRTALSGFDTMVLSTRTPPKPEAAKLTTYIFNVAEGPLPGSVNVTVEHAASGQIILDRVLAALDLEPAGLDAKIAELVTTTSTVSGAIYTHMEKHGFQQGLAKCLLQNDNYYLSQTPENHRLAYDCFAALQKERPDSATVLSEMAVLVRETVSDGYGYPAGATKEDALAMARAAIQLAPTSPYAHRAYSYLFTSLGDHKTAVEWIRKAYELNPFDLSMAAAYGYALIMSGDYSTGVPYLSRAVAGISSRPTWWDYSLFLGAFMIDDEASAAQAASALATSKRAHYKAARLLVAKMQGDMEKVQLLAAELRKSNPDFARNPAATYKKANYPKDLIEKMVEQLRAAGLGGES